MANAATHCHLDMKEEFLNVFLNNLIERFEPELSCESADPRTQLNMVLDAVFSPRNPETDGFPVAVMEPKAQAPHHELFRERFLDFDDVIREVVADTIHDGIAGEESDRTDPEKIARLIATMNSGMYTYVITLDEYPAETRRTIENALELHLGWTPGKGVDG